MKDILTSQPAPAPRRGYCRRLRLWGIVGAAAMMAHLSVPAWAESKASGDQTADAPAPDAAAPLTPEEKAFRAAMQEVGVAFSQRRFAVAEEKLNEAAKLRPGSDDVEGARAGILAETGRYDEALAIYNKMVEAHPKAFVPRFNQAEVYCMQKKYDEAKQLFEVLLKDFPDSDFLCYKLMLISLAEKDGPKAAEWGRRLQRPTPTPVMFYAAAALSISGGEIFKGKALILAAEKNFGAGAHALLYQSLAAMGLVLQGDYPPKAPQGAASVSPADITPAAHQVEGKDAGISLQQKGSETEKAE